MMSPPTLVQRLTQENQEQQDLIQRLNYRVDKLEDFLRSIDEVMNKQNKGAKLDYGTFATKGLP